MKTLRNIVIAAIVGIVGFSGYQMFAPNVYADVASLNQVVAGKKATDSIVVYGNAICGGGGCASGINWTQITDEVVSGINWSSIVLSNNSVNWAQVNLPTRP
jgi:hypothetical protein